MKDKLLKIIQHYGINKQLKYIHSEYYELDEAIISYENAKDSNRIHNCTIWYDLSQFKEDISGEIADVMVMLKQFQYYYGITDEQIEEIMNYKIDRQLDRISEEK